MYNSLWKIVTGEWLLDHFTNGSGIIVIRSLFCTMGIYAITIALAITVDPDSTVLESNSLNWIAIRYWIIKTIPWLGAILASCYVALYSRFSAQWTYLADLYNQIKQTECQVGFEPDEAFYQWQAAFIEDCYHLHLLRKPNFLFVSRHWHKNSQVRSMLKKFSDKGVYDAIFRILKSNAYRETTK